MQAISHNRRAMMRAMALAPTALLGVGGTSAVRAADATFPSRTVRLIVPFSPGSNTDALARLYGKALSEQFKQSVVIENRPGGNGIPAVQAVLSAPADGHALLFTGNSALTTNVAVLKKLPYNPLTDLAPVSLVGGQFLLVAVPANSPYKTLQELFADARRRPAALNHGAGSPSYALWGAWLNELAGIKTTNILYKGAGEVLTAVAGGQVDYAVVDASASSEHVKGGRIRALGYTGAERYAVLPEVPTMKEAGLPGFNPMAWSAVAISAKTPETIQAGLVAALVKAGSSPEVRAFMERYAMKPLTPGPQEMRRFQVEEIERWKRLIASTGIQLE